MLIERWLIDVVQRLYNNVDTTSMLRFRRRDLYQNTTLKQCCVPVGQLQTILLNQYERSTSLELFLKEYMA